MPRSDKNTKAGIKPPFKNSYKQAKKKLPKPEPKIKKIQADSAENFDFFQLAEASPSAILIYSDEKVHWVNKAASDLTDYSKKELLNMNFWDIIHPEEMKHVKETGLKRLKGEKLATNYEFRILTKKGNVKYIEYAANLTKYKGHPVVVGVALDITNKKLLEERINQKNNQRIKFQNALLNLLRSNENNIEKKFGIITRTIAECLFADRISIWLFDENKKHLNCHSLFVQSKKEHVTKDSLVVADYPMYFKALANNLNITTDDVYNNKYTKEFNESYHKPYRIYSIIDIPIRSQGKVIGVLCCEHTEIKRIWTEEEQDFVIAVSEIISQNIETHERVKADLSLRQANNEISKAFDQLKDREEIIELEKEKLEVTLRSIGDGVITTDTKGKIILLNKTAEMLTGWTQSEAKGLPLEEVFVIIDETTGEKCVSPVSRVIKTGEIAEPANHTSLISKKGNVWIISHNAAPIRDKKDRIFGVILVFRDISEQTEAKQNLRESEEGYRTLFEGANDAIFIMQENIFIACNEKALKMFKCHSENIIGKSPRDFSPKIQYNGQSSDESAAEKIKLAYEGYPQFFEWKHLQYDGTEFDAEVGLNKIEVQGAPYLQAVVRDITERKKSELKIAENLRLLRESQEVARLGSYTWDIQSGIWRSSDILDDIFGIDQDYERTLEGWVALIHPEWQGIMNDYILNEVLSKKARFDKEYKIRRFQDGQVRWVHGLGQLEYNSDGNPIQLIGTISDITDRKKAEEALRESESNLRNILEMSNISIAIVNLDGNIEYINRQSIRTFGYLHDEIPNMDAWWLLAYPDEEYRKEVKEHWMGLIAKAIKGNGEIERSDYYVTCKDGSIKAMIIFGVIVNNKVFVMFEDITDRKISEEAIKQSEKQFRTIFENAPIGKCLVGLDTCFLKVNNSFCEILGYSREELLNSSFLNYTHPDDVEKSKIWIGEIKAGINSSPHIEKRYLHKKGYIIWGHVSVSLFRNAAGTPEYFIVQIIDITNKKRSEENLEKFKFIVEGTSEEFYLVNPYGKFEYVNKAAADSLGYTIEEIMELGIPGIDMTFKTPEAYYQHFLSLRTKETPAFETQHRTKDGRLLTKLVKAEYLQIGEEEYVCGFANDISETKKAADIIKRNEEKFRLLFTSTSQAVTLNEIILNEDGEPCDYRILEANPAFETHTGLKGSDFIGKRVLEVLPNTEKYWIKVFGEVALSGIPKRVENFSAELNKYFDFTIYCPRKGQFALISTDITDRKREEKSRLLNVQRLEALIRLNNQSEKSVEHLTDFALEEAVKLTGSKFGYLAFMNEDESIIQLHAWSSEVMNICTVKDSYHQFIVNETGLLGEPIRTRKPVITNDYKKENPLKHGFPEGHVPIIRHLNVPVLDNDKIVVLAGVANKESDYNEADIYQLTLLMGGMWKLIQRRKVDIELQESEERYRFLADHSNDIIAKFGTEGRIAFISPVCKTLLGYEPDDLVGHSVFDYFHPDDIPYMRIYQERLLSERASPLIKHRLRSNTGKYIWFETNNQIILDQDGNIKEFVAVIRDITELMNSEKLIKEKEAAELANKAKSEFLANMSHEIRNPLNSIIGLSNSLSRTEMNEEQANFVESLKISSNNLLNILNDILDFSKIEANKMEIQYNHFSLKNVIQDIHTSNKTSAELKDISYTFSVEDSVPDYLYGDSVKLKQILINLTGNAIKFTERGSVNILAKELSRNSGQSLIRIEVSDTGIGIKKEDSEKLFESFTQLDSSTTKSYAGTGLGLAIVKRYVELLSGSIGLISEPNKGSTFYIEIPFTISEKEATEIDTKQITIADISSKPYILLAEDDGINQLYLKGFLNKMGYDVDTAYNGVQALEKFNSKKYDIILMDGQMPKMDGFEATRLIREQEKSTKTHTVIIAITGYAVSGDKEKFLNAGMDDYVSKPIDEIRLLELLQKHSIKQ